MSASDTKPAESKSGHKSDFGQAEIQKTFDEGDKKGFFGVEVDPIDNKEYSLESGPDSPSVLEQQAAVAKKEAQER